MSGGDLVRLGRDESRPRGEGDLSLTRVLAAKGLWVR